MAGPMWDSCPVQQHHNGMSYHTSRLSSSCYVCPGPRYDHEGAGSCGQHPVCMSLCHLLAVLALQPRGCCRAQLSRVTHHLRRCRRVFVLLNCCMQLLAVSSSLHEVSLQLCPCAHNLPRPDWAGPHANSLAYRGLRQQHGWRNWLSKSTQGRTLTTLPM
jgi:hypothetical protein